MDFDFKSLYISYSNEALLKIIEMPQNYQPTAVSAAEEILATRTVSEEERAKVNEELFGPAAPAIAVKNADGEASIFDDDPLPRHYRLFTVFKWTIISLWGIYQFFRIMDGWFLLRLDLQFGHHTILEAICSFYVILTVLAIVTTVLFAAENKWGWLLLFANVLYFIVIQLMISISIMRSNNGYLPYWPGTFLILCIAILYFLQRPELYPHYITDAFLIRFRRWCFIGAAILFLFRYYTLFIFQPGAGF